MPDSTLHYTITCHLILPSTTPHPLTPHPLSVSLPITLSLTHTLSLYIYLFLWTRYADDGDNTGPPLKLDTGGVHTHADQVFRGSLDLEPQTIKYLIYIRHNIILYEQVYQQKYINVGCKCRV